MYLPIYNAKLRTKLKNKEIDILSFIDKTPVEKLHLQFCKNILGLKKCTSNLGVRQELGRLPVQQFIWKQSLLYYVRLCNQDVNPLLKESLLLAKDLDAHGTYSWFTYIKEIFSELDLEIENFNNIDKTKYFKYLISAHCVNYFKNIFQEKMLDIKEKNKIYL